MPDVQVSLCSLTISGPPCLDCRGCFGSLSQGEGFYYHLPVCQGTIYTNVIDLVDSGESDVTRENQPALAVLPQAATVMATPPSNRQNFPSLHSQQPQMRHPQLRIISSSPRQEQQRRMS